MSRRLIASLLVLVLGAASARAQPAPRPAPTIPAAVTPAPGPAAVAPARVRPDDAAPALPGPAVLQAEAFAHHAAYFGTLRRDEPPPVALVPDAEAWAWLRDRIPLFECSDAEVEEIYYYRWWAVRRHLRALEGGGFVFTEFINRPRPVSSALGHQLMEQRWLRDPRYTDAALDYWLRGHEGGPQPHLRKYSQWLAHAVWQRFFVTGDRGGTLARLDDLVADYRAWEASHGRADGLFWQHDVWDAMEESISGGRRVKNVRPTICPYMFGNASALAALARLAGRADLAAEFDAKAATLRRGVQDTLWDEERAFFTSVTEQLERIPVREAIGFIPWYFDLPEPGRGYERAWAQLVDASGFRAPFGLTTAERRDPTFRSRGIGTCEWDGAVWPFATAQTLTALAHALRNAAADTMPVTARDHFDAFVTFTRAHRYDGEPYIGEYHDEISGQWLKGRDPRSSDYLHSTYADLLIAGVIGLVPRSDDTLQLHPLLPPEAWSWFALDGVRYHGRTLTILWDRSGARYGRGPGLHVLVDGAPLAHAPTLAPLTVALPSP